MIIRKFFFLFIALNFLSPLYSVNIEERINEISWFDKVCMRRFFNYIIKSDQAVHTIFFDSKPVCFTGIILKDKERTFNDLLCSRGWKVFRENDFLFPHPNFIFSESTYEDTQFKTVNIFIVNKKATLNCLQQNENLFKKTLGANFSPVHFLSQLEKGMPLKSLIHDNEMLFGILLGFGEESAIAFLKAHERCNKNSIPEWTETYCGLEAKQPKGCNIAPICFMGNPNSSEVKKVLKQCEKELEEFWVIYQKSEDTLKMVLEALCRN